MESTVGLRWAFSNKRQTAYATALANAELTQSHPFEGADFGEHTPNITDNAALFGKGHEFATNVYLLSWDTRFRRAAFLTSKLAGWALAFHCGKVTTSAGVGAGAYSHVFEYQDPFGAGYYGSGRQQPVTTIVEQVSSGLVRKFPSMLVSAVELSGNMNDFCRIGMDLIGSGYMNRLSTSGTATTASATIGTGANGTVTVTDDTLGPSTKSVRVVAGVGNNVPLSAAISGTVVTVTLGTDAGGLLDPTKNTATLVATAVAGLTGVGATASGTGATALTGAEGPYYLEGEAAGLTAWPGSPAGDEGERLRNTAMLFESGFTGSLADQSCDIRSWRFRSEYALAEEDGYCPGSGYLVTGDPSSGQIRNKLEFLRRAILLEWVVRASASNTYFHRLERQYELAARITLEGATINGTDDHSVIINVPQLKYRAVPIGADGDVITYSVQTVIMYDDTLANPFEITVVNDTATYLTT